MELEIAAYDGQADGSYLFNIVVQDGVRVIELQELFSEFWEC